MRICANCEQVNPDEAKFCLNCATPLPQERVELRKVVTLLFADVIGSTAAADRLDPESVRRMMQRYFETARTIIERHGGTVEKFVGDAVMAVFGIPTIHEDDALRAVRAAAEMKSALAGLSSEIEATFGTPLQARIGVNTGEVIAGDPSRGEAFVSGDPVNVAARLEQSAPPGQILIGETTYQLVRDAVIVEPVDGLEVKGKPTPVGAYQLLTVDPTSPGTSRAETPLIGRNRELERVVLTLREAFAARETRLVTIVGSAGVGKSRLAAEVEATVADDARLYRGRCLSYGEGITYWPILEILTQLTGIEERDETEAVLAKLRTLVGREDADELIVSRLTRLLGISEGAADAQETFWALRKLFEVVARDRPTIVMFDDIQWAEPMLLDLLEYLVDFTHDVPFGLVCLARPDLYEVRPDFGAGRPNSIAIALEPLSDEHSSVLASVLLDGVDLPSDVMSRVHSSTRGNPLFVTELLRMLVEQGFLGKDNGSWVVARELSELNVPPTVAALLGARLDGLPDRERSVLQRASVIGQVFWWGAVATLSPAPERPTVGAHLRTLTRKELVRPDASTFAGEDAFSFGHILVRDAAYESLPKEARAELHRCFADWLVGKAADRVSEHDEILGYHFDQAFVYRSELGKHDDVTRDIAAAAARHLAAAGGRARARGDIPAAGKLLRRALELAPEDGDRTSWLLDLYYVVREEAQAVESLALLRSAIDLGRKTGDRRTEWRAELLSTDPLLQLGQMSADEGVDVIERLLPDLEAAGDDELLGIAWAQIATMHNVRAESEEQIEAAMRAFRYADRAGDTSTASDAIVEIVIALAFGHASVDEIERRVDELETWVQHPRAEAGVAICRAAALALRGRIDEARRVASEALQLLHDFGYVSDANSWTMGVGVMELTSGDAARAEQLMRPAAKRLLQANLLSYYSTAAAYIAEAICRQDRFEEAREWIREAERTGPPDDLATQVGIRNVNAKLLSLEGRFEEAEELAWAALAESRHRGGFELSSSLETLSLVLEKRGNKDAAADVTREALELYESKGSSVAAERARARLEELRRAS